MKNRNILMTGATGFLGSNLAKCLLEQGHELSILKRSYSDIFRLAEIEGKLRMYNLDKESIEDCLKKAAPDIIIHCATDYGRKDVGPSSIIEANLILPLKLLELCKRYKVSCFINTDTFLDKGINYYSLSKKQFKEWLDTYATDLICINIILEHFYGPFDDKTKFVSFIIEKFLSGATEINLTQGRQKRDFIFINDVVTAFACVIKHIPDLLNGFYSYGIGSNRQIEIRELVETMKEIAGNKVTKLNFGVLPYRKNEVMESNIDTSVIRKLGWKPKYNLTEGLCETIAAEKNRKQ